MPNDSDNPLEPVTGSEMYHRALELFEQGDLNASLTYVDRALELGHVDADSCLLKAQVLFDMKRLADALTWIGEAAAFSPLNTEVSLWRGRVFAAQRKYRRALACYGRVLEREPNNADAMLHRGVAFFELGDVEAAEDAFGAAQRLTKDNDEREAELYYWRARLERASGRFDVARRLLEDALLRYDQHIAAYAELGDLLRSEARSNRDLRSARKIYERGLTIDPSDPSLHNDYGNLLREMRDLEGSLKHLSKAIEINPSHEVAYFNRGLTYEELGQLERAVSDFRRAVDLDPSDTDAKLKVLDVLLALERFDAAQAMYGAACDADPGHPELHWSAADLYSRWALWCEGHGRYREALRCHRRLLDIAPDLLDLEEYVPYFSSSTERWRAAERGCAALLPAEQARQLGLGDDATSDAGLDDNRPVARDALLVIGICRLRLNDLEGAEAALRLYVAANDADATGHAMLAQVLASMNRPLDALAGFDAALARSQDNPEFLWEKAQLLESLREFEAAVACHEAILRRSANYRWCHEPLVRLCEELGQPGRALYHLRRLVAYLQDRGQIEPHEAALQGVAGRLYVALGWYDRAIERLHAALDRPQLRVAERVRHARSGGAAWDASASAADTASVDLPAVDRYASPAGRRRASDPRPTDPVDSAEAIADDDDDSPIFSMTRLHVGEANYLLGLAYARTDRPRQARIYFDKVIADCASHEPELAGAAFDALADLFARQGRLSMADEYLRQAAALVPGEQRQRQLTRARVAMQQEAWPLAEELAGRAAEQSQSHDELYLEAMALHGEIALRSGQPAVARRLLDEATGAHPLSVRIQALRVSAGAAGQDVAYRLEAEKALSLARAIKEAYAALGRGEGSVALVAVERCRSLSVTDDKAWAAQLDLLEAGAHAALGDVPALLSCLRAGLRRAPERIAEARYWPGFDPYSDSAAFVQVLTEVAAEAVAAGRLAQAPAILPATETTDAPPPGRWRTSKDESEPTSERAPRAKAGLSTGASDEDLIRDALHGIDWDSLGSGS